MRRTRGELLLRVFAAVVVVLRCPVGFLVGVWGLAVVCAGQNSASKNTNRKIRIDFWSRPTTVYLLSPKIGAHDGNIIFREAADDLIVEVISTGGGCIAVTLLVRPPAFLDIFLQPVVEIFVFASFGYLHLVVEFDFIY